MWRFSKHVQLDLTGFSSVKNLVSSRNCNRIYSISSTIQKADDKHLHIHISPCGDWWLGAEIYAAKHLPSGYVRSIKLPDNFDEEDSHLLDELPASDFSQMYDTGILNVAILMAIPMEKKVSDHKKPSL